MNVLADIYSWLTKTEPPERFRNVGHGWTPTNAVEDAYTQIKHAGYKMSNFKCYEQNNIYYCFVEVNGSLYHFTVDLIDQSEYTAHLQKVPTTIPFDEYLAQSIRAKT